MQEMGLPREVLNRIERRWMAKFAQSSQARPSAARCDDPLWSPQVHRLLNGSLKPPRRQRSTKFNCA